MRMWSDEEFLINPDSCLLLPSRSIISECLASFLYVFIVCGAAAGSGVGASVSSVLLATALASGFTVATLTQCFAHISGEYWLMEDVETRQWREEETSFGDTHGILVYLAIVQYNSLIITVNFGERTRTRLLLAKRSISLVLWSASAFGPVCGSSA